MVAAPLQSRQRISVAGFTLLEVLVALAVMGLLLFGLVQGSHFVLLGWDRQTRLAARTEDLDAVDEPYGAWSFRPSQARSGSH
jgi:prepilin-type N-terminal cleavage/methylation domain-containing protein